MQYFEWLPSSRLAPYIKKYWFLEGHVPAEAVQPERIFPDGCMELIIHYGDAFQKITGKGTEQQANGFVYGQLEEYIELLPGVSTGVMGIKFFPAGLSYFTRVPVHEMKQQAILLPDIFSLDGVHLAEAIALAGKPAEKVKQAEQFLLQQLVAGKKKEPLTSILVNDIYQQKGNLTVSNLTGQYAVTERQLERLFARDIGLSPKLFCRIVRFQHVFQLAPRSTSFTGLALDAGYFDQAHFTREFKIFTGLSPTQYFKGQHNLAALFLDD